MPPIRIGIVAGEASGDLLAARLVQALRKLHPNLEFEGIAGPQMIDKGVVAKFPMEKLAVRGYVEVLRHFREIQDIRKNLKEYWLSRPPHLFIGIDAPDFNLGLEESLKQAGIPTVHFVSPSIWAWRGRRIKQIARAVTHMLLVFPFEKSLYQHAQIPATYVGHPLADSIPLLPDRARARAELNLGKANPVFAFLPGSRQSEVKLHARLFLETMALLEQRHPAGIFLMPLVSEETVALMHAEIDHFAHASQRLTILQGKAEQAMTAADVVLVASGTATLEAALLKRPMVITYKVPALTAVLMWPRRLLPYIGLPNILAGEMLVPEILQGHATPQRLATALDAQLEDNAARKKLMEKFTQMHIELRQNSAQQAAQTIMQLLPIHTPSRP